VYSVLFI